MAYSDCLVEAMVEFWIVIQTVKELALLEK
jgi:hypothetical protein